MLKLSRVKQQSIVVGDDIRITVLAHTRSDIVFSIEAPEDVELDIEDTHNGDLLWIPD